MKILAAIDGSEASFNALRSACRIADRMRWYVTAFHVNKGMEYSPEETGWTSIKERLARELEISGHEIISKSYEIGKSFGVSLDGVMSEGVPVQEILKYVSAHGIIKLIAMGHSSKGRGTQEFVESVTRSVVAQSGVPVLVTDRDTTIEKILIAVDDSESSKRATAFGATLARTLGADLGVLSFVPDAEATISEYTMIAEVPNINRYIEASEKSLKEMVERTLASTKEILDSIGVGAPLMVKKGRPSEEILTESRHYDLLVVGLRGGQSVKKLSAVAGRVIDSSEINVVFMQ